MARFAALGLAVVAGVVAILAIWANDQLLDTGSWVAVSGRLLEDKEVRHRVAGSSAKNWSARRKRSCGGRAGRSRRDRDPAAARRADAAGRTGDEDGALQAHADRDAADAAWGIATTTIQHLAIGSIVTGGLTFLGALFASRRRVAAR